MNASIATNPLFAVAREVIQLRAARDGYPPQEYDAKRDPEGYITSLLNALHLWCRANAIDWEEELVSAQGFFEQDVAESECPEQRLSKPTVEELRCPECRQDACFVIEVTERQLMFTDGVVLYGDSGEEWGDWSYCRCHACQHRGTVYQFRKTLQPTEA